MRKSIPDFLWIHNIVRARQLFHGKPGVQVDADLLICLIYQLAAIKGIFPFRV